MPQWPALLYLHVWQPAYMGPFFWTGGEMQIETILQYYGVPTVSARNALFHLAARNAPGFAQNDTNCGVHPNPLGHRYPPASYTTRLPVTRRQRHLAWRQDVALDTWAPSMLSCCSGHCWKLTFVECPDAGLTANRLEAFKSSPATAQVLCRYGHS